MAAESTFLSRRVSHSTTRTLQSIDAVLLPTRGCGAGLVFGLGPSILQALQRHKRIPSRACHARLSPELTYKNPRVRGRCSGAALGPLLLAPLSNAGRRRLTHAPTIRRVWPSVKIALGLSVPRQTRAIFPLSASMQSHKTSHRTRGMAEYLMAPVVSYSRARCMRPRVARLTSAAFTPRPLRKS